MQSTRRARRSRADNETGATLILVLGYILVVGMVIGALAVWVTNDLDNGTKFATADAQETATTNAMDLAIQSIRYAPLVGPGQTQNAAPPSYCWGNTAPSSLTDVSGQSVSVWCSTQWTPMSTTTRVVTFSACPSNLSASQCAASATLQAVVTYDDYPVGGGTPTESVCTTTCGEGMTINSWSWLDQS